MAKADSNYSVWNALNTEQWATRVIEYSSQYNADGWAATKAIGPPQVYPQYGDIQGAWAQGNYTAEEFIELEYEEAIFVKGLDIYETYNGGAVVRILARPSGDVIDKDWRTIWTAPDGPERFEQSRIFKPDVKSDYKVDAIKLILDCTLAQTWTEIDAVKLIGQRILIETSDSMKSLSHDMATLVNNQDFSDVKFEVEGKEVYAHKSILSARSTYFQAMFSSDSQQFIKNPDVIPMPDIDYETFLGVLQYIYTNKVDNLSTEVIKAKLVRVSDLYDLPGLKGLATCQLYLSLNVDNVIDIYREAVEKLPPLNDIEDLCASFISSNLRDVSRTSAFCALPQDTMLKVIQLSTANLKIK